MVVIANGSERKVICELSIYELESITGLKIENGSYYSRDSIPVEKLIGKEYKIDKLAETIKLATAIKYHAKSSVDSLERIKKSLDTALFPFLDSYERAND